ncbi:hypothetical protein ITP53_13635 [Nonomuraea sp. K274]|uniref:Uncharacterized protein n=1 Tax=Nonomuraea cypriaca TaxID=1187855 RepID=A0A931AAZ0_9ACTN|nr:hypothetical protein [Nonomuraea cypriaca]MBF8186764.1 hypothetical protein [Nonomuraea cypriaca]
MGDQFDVIEVGERGRRRSIGLVVVFVLLLVPIVGLIVSREPEPQPPPEAVLPAPSPIRSLTRMENDTPSNLTAPVTTKGGDEVIEVVFPHGVRAEVRYPARLGLADLGSRPFQGVWVGERYREFVAPYNGEIEITRGGEPLRSYAPNVTLWPRQAGSRSYGQVLLFEFGPWRLAMYDRGEGLTFDQRTALARALRGTVTKDGYLVLSAKTDIRLAEPGDTAEGDPAGPQLRFGGGVGPMLALVPTPDCRRQARQTTAISGRGRPADTVCRDGVLVAATGPHWFRRLAVEEIRITLK